MLTAFLILVGQFSYAGVVKTEEKAKSVKAEFSFDHSDFAGCAHSGYPVPADTEPNPESPEISDSSEEFTDDFGDFNCHSIPAEIIQHGKVKSALLSFGLLLQGRESVPLFVLHHSWRNFLF